MLQSRGVLSVDGEGNEWSLLWKLLANCVTLLVESSRTWQWYHPLLRPWVHYVPLRPDMSDLADRVNYVLDPANDARLVEIARASTELAMRIDLPSAQRQMKEELEAVFG